MVVVHPLRDKEAGHVERAPRFEVSVPLSYRRIGDVGWVEGDIVNISRTGVLFAVEQLLPEGVGIEMNFDLPEELGGVAGADVICRGEVVRTVLPPASDTDSRPQVAATIDGLSFVSW